MDRDRFQCNSKHAALPCEGEVAVGDRRYVLDPRRVPRGAGFRPRHLALSLVLELGRRDRRPGRRALGVNFGAKWTTGTGVNENGILFDGRLHKIMEDLRWEYDPSDWCGRGASRRTPARSTSCSSPSPRTASSTNLGVLARGGVCGFGRWHGTIRVDGQARPVRDLIGWAEEFNHRW